MHRGRNGPAIPWHPVCGDSTTLFKKLAGEDAGRT
jgi:hypothetical protein